MLEYTKEEIQVLQEARLTILIEHVGGMTHLSKMLNVPFTTVQGWVRRKKISIKGAKICERHPSLKKKFKVKYLRPEFIK